MRYCESCKLEYPDEKKFCRTCGSALVAKAEPEVEPSFSLRCPSCNAEVTAGKKFCRRCGAVLENMTTPKSEEVHGNLCPRCGSPLTTGKRFCGKCGLNLSVPSPEISSAPDLVFAGVSTPKAPGVPVLSQAAAAVVTIQPSVRTDKDGAIETPEPIITGAVVAEELLGTDAPPAGGFPAPVPPGESESKIVPISISAPAESVPAAEAALGVATEGKHASPLLIIAACVVALALGGVLLWYFVLSPEARISRAVNRGDLVTPVGKSAYDLYQNSKSGLGASARERIRAKAVGKVLDAANNMVQKRTQGESMLQSEVDQLVRLYSWAADLAPKDRRALAGQNYAQALATNISGKPKAALPLLLRSTDYDSNWAPAFNELGKTYVKLNDHSHAAEAYKRAIAIDPTWVFPQLNLGGVYLHDKQWDLAEQSYLNCIQLDPTLATSWYFLGQVYEAQRKFGNAVDAYEHAVQTAAKRPSSAFKVDMLQRRVEVLKQKPSYVPVESLSNNFQRGSSRAGCGDIITTIAGTGQMSASGDGGQAGAASLNPHGLAFDPWGNLFVADYTNNRIRRISPDGAIATVVGNGMQGFSGDGGPASMATLSQPIDVAVDHAGNLYIADFGNNRIRKVTRAGIITTIAGSGSVGFDGGGFSGDGGPATSARLFQPVAVALDAAGNVYVADRDNNRIRKISTQGTIGTVAGNGQRGFSGDGGPAAAASLWFPSGLALDRAGNLYISDRGRIRKVGLNGIITTVVGTGAEGFAGDGGAATQAVLNAPDGLLIDLAGNLLIADRNNNRIRKVTSGIITTIAGAGAVGYGAAGFSGDGGVATEAALNAPRHLASDSRGSLYVADSSNYRIREIERPRTAGCQ